MDLDAFRKEKDAYFRETDSPLTDAARAAFSGLKYFSQNPALRFSLQLNTGVPHDEVTLQTSTGDLKRYRRAGSVTFPIGGMSISLSVFEDSNGYFLPFRDGTCDAESYSAGRYLEPEMEGDKLVVDFNFAYNPYCAYNEKYSCPIPPKENWTPVRIEAGEKRFHR